MTHMKLRWLRSARRAFMPSTSWTSSIVAAVPARSGVTGWIVPPAAQLTSSAKSPSEMCAPPSSRLRSASRRNTSAPPPAASAYMNDTRGLR
jgi:hypothetical protein